MQLKKIKFRLPVLALATAFCAAAASAQPAAFPVRPVTLVVAYPPGGTTDSQARIVAKKMSEIWKQPVVVENKPGGNTVIASGEVAKSKPDGYTLLLTAMPYVLNPMLLSSLPYDTRKDLIPVTLLSTVPGVFVTYPNFGVHNVQEFLAKAKAAPKPLVFGSAGTATFTHLSGELFSSMAGVDFLHVPYKGSAAAHQDLIAGRLDLMFDNGALPHIQSGRLRALGVTSAKRLPWLPDVPTIEEQGLPGYEAAAWFGIFAAGGTPAQTVQKISEDFTTALQDPEIKAHFAKIGAFAEGGSPARLEQYLDAEQTRWGKIVKERNIKIQ